MLFSDRQTFEDLSNISQFQVFWFLKISFSKPYSIQPRIATCGLFIQNAQCTLRYSVVFLSIYHFAIHVIVVFGDFNRIFNVECGRNLNESHSLANKSISQTAVVASSKIINYTIRVVVFLFANPFATQSAMFTNRMNIAGWNASSIEMSQSEWWRRGAAGVVGLIDARVRARANISTGFFPSKCWYICCFNVDGDTLTYSEWTFRIRRMQWSTKEIEEYWIVICIHSSNKIHRTINTTLWIISWMLQCDAIICILTLHSNTIPCFCLNINDWMNVHWTYRLLGLMLGLFWWKIQHTTWLGSDALSAHKRNF